MLVAGSIDSPGLGESWPRSRIHPGCPSGNKRRQGQRQGWRQGCDVDLKSMHEAGLEAGTPMALLVQGLS